MKSMRLITPSVLATVLLLATTGCTTVCDDFCGRYVDFSEDCINILEAEQSLVCGFKGSKGDAVDDCVARCDHGRDSLSSSELDDFDPCLECTVKDWPEGCTDEAIEATDGSCAAECEDADGEVEQFWQEFDAEDFARDNVDCD